MTIAQLLFAIFIYMSVISIIVGYAACAIAGRSDAGLVDESTQADPEPASYTIYRVQDEQLAVS